MTGKENLNLFNDKMNKGIFNQIDNRSKEMAQNGDKVFQVVVDYYDPHKEGYGLKQPVYEDRDRMVFPTDGEPRHEQLRPANFPTEKSRAADKAASNNAPDPRNLEPSKPISSNSQAEAEAAVQGRVHSIREAIGKPGDKSSSKAPSSGNAEPARPAAPTSTRGEYRTSSAKVDAIREALRQQRSQPGTIPSPMSKLAGAPAMKIEGSPAGTSTVKVTNSPSPGTPSPLPPPSSPVAPGHHSVAKTSDVAVPLHR